MTEHIIFTALASLIAMASLMVVLARNPVASSLFLVLDLFALAGLFTTMNAHFVAAIQVLVYAGAIVVLFVFVIMLLNLDPSENPVLHIPAPEWAVLIALTIGFFILGGFVLTSPPTSQVLTQGEPVFQGLTKDLGIHLFTKYLWPFELASILILMAVVAAIVIAKKPKKTKT